MKFLHISDIHLGKQVNGFSMIDEQKYILNQILDIIKKELPNCILITGDIYDKPIPPAEAVTLLDDFLTELCECEVAVYIISGNHDSSERMNFGSKLFKKNKIHIASVLQSEIYHNIEFDEFGEVSFYLCPFLKPAMLTPFLNGEKPDTYEEAMKAVLDKISLDKEKRNILLSHQFVTNCGAAKLSDSENLSLGGLDNIDYTFFNDFDYVALGHLHSPQRIGRDTVRYAGSPLKYSFSEIRQKKSVTFVEMKEKGSIDIRQIPLIPKLDLREIKGKLLDLTNADVVSTENKNDYIHVILTDEEEVYDAIGRLRSIYPNIMAIDFQKRQDRNTNNRPTFNEISQLSPMTLFKQFYEMQNDMPISAVQEMILEKLFEKIGGDF